MSRNVIEIRDYITSPTLRESIVFKESQERSAQELKNDVQALLCKYLLVQQLLQDEMMSLAESLGNNFSHEERKNIFKMSKIGLEKFQIMVGANG